MFQKITLQDVVSHAKIYGFIYPSSEIYDGLHAVYDYGHLGFLLKKNIQQFWIDSMLKLHENMVLLDSAILMHPNIWKASGHVDNFHDLLLDNKDSKKRYRLDQLIEQHINKLKEKKEFDKAYHINSLVTVALQNNDWSSIDQLIQDEQIICPIVNNSNFTPVRKYNLMFSTQGHALEDKENRIYLRPETAQGIFVNFLQVQKTSRIKIPFGIAQIGKAFRNEIIAKQFIFRMKEFEQMEMQFFIHPHKEKKWFAYWKKMRMAWCIQLGIAPDRLNFQPHEQLAHYASNAVDIVYAFPFGNKEIEGIHARSDFDLKSHQEFSKKKLTYFDAENNMHYLPYVIETSIGCDRLILALLCENLKIKKEQDKIRIYLSFNPFIAPIKAAILPLVKKNELVHQAKIIFNELKYDYPIMYDDSGSIGKRYMRQDGMGTPFCITIDYDTLHDKMVTIRNRDTLQQERVCISSLFDFLKSKINIKKMLKNLENNLL